ncbi:MAG: hypothetical protein HC830_14200 [Bacteroidetes bacterium]|nr:hypothetical protein [Bacteroidota bacterium]
MPEIGTILNSTSLSETELMLLQEAGIKHFRLDLKFSLKNWEEKLFSAVKISRRSGILLELVLHFTEKIQEEINHLKNFSHNCEIPVKNIRIFEDLSRHTSEKLIDDSLDKLKSIFGEIAIGGGTDAYFAEFNRNRINTSRLDFLTYAVCPQVHAFDNDSLIENFASQADTVESAKALYMGKPVRISPITFKQRFNVVATGEEPPVPADQLPSQVDVRQVSLFAAGWTLGSLWSLSIAKTMAATYYEATGWRGIIQGDNDPEKPELFPGTERRYLSDISFIEIYPQLDTNFCSTLPFQPSA